MKTILIAVYGSLKQGYWNHSRFLNNDQTEFIGTSKTEPEFTMYSLGSYPAVVPKGDTSIVIEVYRITKDIEENLDYLEGYPGFYDKIEIETEYGKAKMYVMNELSGYPVVKSGDWAN